MLVSVLYSVFTYRCGIFNTKPQFLGLVKELLCEKHKPVFGYFFFPPGFKTTAYCSRLLLYTNLYALPAFIRIPLHVK